MQLRSRMSPRNLAQLIAALLVLAAYPAWSTEDADDPEGTDMQTELPEPQELDQQLEKAESIPLDQPVESPAEEPAAAEQAETTEEEIPPAEAAGAKPLRLLGAEVPPATSTRLAWSPSQHFEGVYSSTAVLVVNGAEPGPTLCLTAAVHGDELNGIETVRRVLYNLDPETLKGAVIGVPIVNLQGFHRGSRYLTDRRDLNRHFPGDPNGSSASRIAHSFFHEIIVHCNAVVDLHTGSFYRTNLPQLRGDLTNPKVVKLTKGFGSTVVLHSDGAKGTLRRAAVNAGIPTVTLEAGAPMVLDETSVSHSVKGIRTLLHQLDMVAKFRLWGDPEPVYYNSTWQRATTGGMIFSKVKLGQFVRKGDLLGTVTNPITNVRTEIRSEHNGRVLGMALNQVVQPGFAAYHIGIQAPQEQISAPEEVTAEVTSEEETDQGNGDAGEPKPADVVTEDGEPTGEEPALPESEAIPADAGDEPEAADPDSDDE
ncbi:aspartoacylase [Microbulbifer aggregans]|uniref:Aspartoacylase n=1 Tax=Microbulbifer aggregans TaxID=1769779 RepID=A0A1C9W2Y4_9GAMM|nr:succinylglutamate desuccinylase/aspartoacylase family protein [Microbulbifer aggregans]AOS95509.1 aspartoacylase [Microbulbifer aggregans]